MVKALAFNATGQVVNAVSRPNLICFGNGGAVEQDMQRTWEDTCAVLRELTARLNSAGVVALAITGQGDGTWLIDRENEPVAPAILWLDARAGQLVEDLRTSGAASKAFAFTGTGLAACQQPAQLLWLDQNHPELLERSAIAFHCKDWLYLKLTGERATDPSEASFSFGDFRTRSYQAEVLESLGLTHLGRLLPPIIDGVRQWHGLSADAAAHTGLVQGTPVGTRLFRPGLPSACRWVVWLRSRSRRFHYRDYRNASAASPRARSGGAQRGDDWILHSFSSARPYSADAD